MKIIRVKSGLGNQMFQYALYRQLEYMGQDVRLDVSYINKNQEHNGYELDKVFMLLPDMQQLKNWNTVKEEMVGYTGR